MPDFLEVGRKFGIIMIMKLTFKTKRTSISCCLLLLLLIACPSQESAKDTADKVLHKEEVDKAKAVDQKIQNIQEQSEKELEPSPSPTPE